MRSNRVTATFGSATDEAAISEVHAMQAIRRVHRAASELRRGVPVILNGVAPLLLVAAETAGPGSAKELASLSPEPPVLLLSPARAAAILRAPMRPEDEVAAIAMPLDMLKSYVFQA